MQGRLKKLATLRQTLFESYVDGIVTQADYLFGKSRYEDEARQLEGRLRDLQAEKDALPEASPKQNKWFSAFAKFRDEKEPTREMLLALVEKIYVNEDKQVHIVLNYTNVRTLTRELVDLLIQNIYIYSSTSIEIVWKCGDEYQRLLADTTKKEAAEREQG